MSRSKIIRLTTITFRHKFGIDTDVVFMTYSSVFLPASTSYDTHTRHTLRQLARPRLPEKSNNGNTSSKVCQPLIETHAHQCIDVPESDYRTVFL